MELPSIVPTPSRPDTIDIAWSLVAYSVTITTNPQTRYLTSMSLQQALEQYPEVYAEIFKLGVTLERTIGITADAKEGK
jgi:hypothetical protein